MIEGRQEQILLALGSPQASGLELQAPGQPRPLGSLGLPGLERTLVLRASRPISFPSLHRPSPQALQRERWSVGAGAGSQSHQDSPRHLYLVLTNPLCTDSSVGLCFLLPSLLCPATAERSV